MEESDVPLAMDAREVQGEDFLKHDYNRHLDFSGKMSQQPASLKRMDLSNLEMALKGHESFTPSQNFWQSSQRGPVQHAKNESPRGKHRQDADEYEGCKKLGDGLWSFRTKPKTANSSNKALLFGLKAKRKMRIKGLRSCSNLGTDRERRTQMRRSTRRNGMRSEMAIRGCPGKQEHTASSRWARKEWSWRKDKFATSSSAAPPVQEELRSGMLNALWTKGTRVRRGRLKGKSAGMIGEGGDELVGETSIRFTSAKFRTTRSIWICSQGLVRRANPSLLAPPSAPRIRITCSNACMPLLLSPSSAPLSSFFPLLPPAFPHLLISAWLHPHSHFSLQLLGCSRLERAGSHGGKGSSSSLCRRNRIRVAMMRSECKEKNVMYRRSKQTNNHKTDSRRA
eukprot:762521-Hanusia_phi.AAC.16